MKNRGIKKIIASFLVAAIVLTASPLSGFVGLKLPEQLRQWFSISLKAKALSDKGTCGEHITYTYDFLAHVLTISSDNEEYLYLESGYFNNNKEIKKVIINNYIYCIADDAFSGCTGITSVTISNSVESIHNNAFKNCSSLKSIIIPDSVVYIGYSAFSGCKELTKATLPNGINEISGELFYNCTKLSDVSIPQGVREIEQRSFYGCESLTEISLPDSVASIGESSFYGCINLSRIYYSDNIEYVGGSAFTDTAFINDSSNWSNNVLYVGKCLVKAKSEISGNYVVRSDTKYITDCAFCDCNKLTSVTVYGGMGVSVFNRCTSLKSVILHDTKVIPSWTFLDCKSLMSVSIPDTCYAIGSEAFAGCTSLENIIIPDSVTDLGCDYRYLNSSAAFYNCINLKEITMPCSLDVGYIYYHSSCGKITNFYGCNNLQKITLTKGKGKMIDYTQSYFKPTEDGEYNCLNNYNISPWYYTYKAVEIVIEEGVTNIGENSFYHCLNVSKITIPSTIKTIGNGAFVGSSIKEIDIRNELSEISDSMFKDCSKLLRITIPDSVTNIGSFAFSGCTNLTSITIPDGVTNIGCDAFYKCTSLANITIPDSVTRIGSYSFYGCTGLINIKIPDNVTSIGDSTFSGCTGLTNITIPKRVSSIGNWAFDYCTGLTSITIPDSVTDIGVNAFKNCSNCLSLELPYSLINNRELTGDNRLPSLKNLTINMAQNAVLEKRSDDILSKSKNTLETVEINGASYSVGNEFLKNYSALNDISLSSGVQSIGADSFVGTAYYNNSDNWSNGCLYIGSYLIKGDNSKISSSLSMAQSTELIADSAFANCDSLEKVVIPDLIDKIPSKCFSNCKNLSNVVLGDNVSVIADDAFENCAVNELTVGNAMTSIPSKIYNSTSLKKITVGNGIKSIGSKAFYNFTNLESVSLPTSVSSIGESAFYNCKKLNSINIPNGVTSIRNNTFNGCGRLTSISLPDNLKSIGNYAFDDCSSLTAVSIPESIIGIGEGAFKGCSSINSISIPTGVSSVKKWTFAYCSSLNSVNIPSSVTSIEGYAFDGCKSLRTISLPDSIYKIEDYTFNGCSSLNGITIPENVISIGNCAFNKCSSFTNITIPNKVVSIGAKAFANCTNLKSVTIPKSVSGIGVDAFKNASESFVIYGYGGTTAENYAKENGIRFVDISVKPVSAEIITMPNKLLYNVGDTLDLSGLELKVKYSDGSYKNVSDNLQCKTTVLTASGTQTITVNYNDVSVSFDVSVIDPSINNAAFVCSNVKATPGSTVVVPILVKNNPGIIAAKIGIKYDTSKLTLINVKDNNLFGYETVSFSNNTDSMPYWITWEDYSAFDNYADNGTVVYVTFKVKENAELGMTPITIIVDGQATYNLDLDNVEFVSVGGSVDIDSRVCGDIDDDGDITLKDVVVLKRYLAENNSVTINTINADINNDGQINLKDVVVLKRYLAGGWGIELA